MEGNQYRDAAGRIVETVGRDSILSATHCTTGLKLVVKDKGRIDERRLQEIRIVKGTFFNAGQYQTVLGTGVVNKVYGEMEGLGLNTLSRRERGELVKSQQRDVERMIRMLGDIFIPIIPVIAATGLFLGLKDYVSNDNVLGLLGLSASTISDYVVTLVNMPTETAFALLLALICWSAFKVFEGTPVIDLVIGLMLVSPSLPSTYTMATPGSGVEAVMAFSRIPIVDCQGSILTAILAVFPGASMEKKLRKVIPNTLDLIMTPFLVMLGTFPVVTLGVGPVMRVVKLKLVTIVEMLAHLPFGIGGFLIGATYPLLVIIGLHHIYTMTEASPLTSTGFSPAITLYAMYGFANMETYLTFFVKSKEQSVESASIGTVLSQLFRISRPVLFGIQLCYNLCPLVIILFTSGPRAALLSVLGIQSDSYRLAVFPSYLMYIYKGNQLMWYFIVSLYPAACCFFLTCLFGVPRGVLEAGGKPHDPEFRGNQLTGENAGEMPDEITGEAASDMVSPADGHILPLNRVKDEVFAGEMLGDGFAAELTGGRILSPANSTIEAVFDMGHAVEVRTENRMEILIHISINTAELEGKGFRLHVSQGQKVRRGDYLVDVDSEEVRKTGKDLTTMIIFTTGENVAVKSGEAVTAGAGFEIWIGQKGTRGSELS